MLHGMLNLLVMSMTVPLWRQSSVAIITSMEITSNHSLFERSFILGVLGGASSSEAFQIPLFAQTGMPNFDPVLPLLILIITLEQMTIKHLMYTQNVPLYYTERARVVFPALRFTLKEKLC